MGLFLGSGYLDGGIFFYGFVCELFYVYVFVNLLYLLIGGFVIWVGYWLVVWVLMVVV